MLYVLRNGGYFRSRTSSIFWSIRIERVARESFGETIRNGPWWSGAGCAAMGWETLTASAGLSPLSTTVAAS